MADVVITIDNPETAVALNCAAAAMRGNAVSPMPNVGSWNHVPTQLGSRRIDGTRVSTADTGYAAGTSVAALTKQGAPPRGEPR